MQSFPVLVRELRRLIQVDLTWGWVGLLAGLMRWLSDRDSHPGLWAALAAVALAGYWANRTMSAEVEDETLEHLGTLPVGAFSCVMQIGTGAALAAVAYAMPLALFGGPVTANELDTFARGAAMALVAGWIGAFGGFQFRSGLFASAFNMLWMGWLLACVGSLLVAGALFLPLASAVPWTLVAGFGLAATIYRLWLYCDGQWVESLMPDPTASIRAAVAAEAGPAESGPMWLTPDGWSPIGFQTLRAHPWRTLTGLLMPAGVTLLLSYEFGQLHERSGMDVMAIVIMLVPVIVMLSVAGSTARARRQGLWDDLLVTPLPARLFLFGHVVPALLVLLGGLVIWLAAWCGCVDHVTNHTALGAGFLAAMLVGGVLAGFLAGACVTGWRAGLLALGIGGLTSACVYVLAATPLLLFRDMPEELAFAMLVPASLVAYASLYTLGLKRIESLRAGA